MILYCIRCGRPSLVAGGQEACPPPCNGAVFVSTPPRLRLTKDDAAYLRSIKIRPPDDDGIPRGQT